MSTPIVGVYYRPRDARRASKIVRVSYVEPNAIWLVRRGRDIIRTFPQDSGRPVPPARFAALYVPVDATTQAELARLDAEHELLMDMAVRVSRQWKKTAREARS